MEFHLNGPSRIPVPPGRFLLLLAAIIPHDNKHYREWSRKVFVGYSFYPCKIQSSKSGFRYMLHFWQIHTACLLLKFPLSCFPKINPASFSMICTTDLMLRLSGYDRIKSITLYHVRYSLLS